MPDPLARFLTATLTPLLNNVTQISAGQELTYMVTQSGLALSAGQNSLGQLGLGKLSASNGISVVSETYRTSVKFVHSGYRWAFLIDINGAAYYFGDLEFHIKPETIFGKFARA
jgi:alpha-tubulin suppressor-like RCC1 family protein